MSKTNPCARTVTPEEAYEVWQEGDTTHWVLKKYKTPVQEEKNPYSAWFVATKSPGTFGRYEYSDTYAINIKNNCVPTDNPLCSYLCVRLDNETTFTLAQLEKYRYQQMRIQDQMLVNYMRLAVPKTKLMVFQEIAQAHKLTIVTIDAENEVDLCRIDQHNYRVDLLEGNNGG